MPQDTNPFAQWAPETLARGARLLPAVGEEANPFAQWAPSGPAAITAEPEEEMGEFAKGVGGGVDFFQSTMGVLGIAMGRVFGSEEMEAYGEELRSRNIEEGKQYQAKVGRVEDIRSISDAFDYASFTLGHLLPSIGASVVGGAVGTIAGGAMGLAPGAVIGGLAGAFAPSLLLNGGEVYNDLREKGVDSFSAAATAGIPMALLDMFVPGRVAGKLVWKPSKKALLKTAKGAKKEPRKFLKRLRQETGRTALVESGTEGLQETIALAVETDVTGEKFVTNENLSRILNGAVAGLLGGGVVGPLAALRADPTPIEAATEEELADAVGGGEPPGGGAAAPVAEAGVDPATGLPIVPEPTDETTAQPAQTGLTGQAAQSPVEPGPQPPGPPGTPVPVQEEVVEAPDVAAAPAEAAVEPTPVSEVVAPGPTEIAPQPAEKEPAAPEETEDALERVQAVLDGEYLAFAKKKQQADVAKILGMDEKDIKGMGTALAEIGYTPGPVAKKPTPEKPKAAKPAPKVTTEPALTEDEQTLKRLKAKKRKTRGDELTIKRLEAQANADPTKWNVGDGVGWRVGPGSKQINRGFRIVETDQENKTVTISQVADTGITVTGGVDQIEDQTVHIADLVRDKKYTAAPKAKPTPTPAPKPKKEAAPTPEPQVEERHPGQLTLEEYGSEVKKRAIEGTESDLADAKRGEMTVGPFSRFKSKAAAVRGIKEDLADLKARAPETFQDGHLRGVNEAIEAGLEIPEANLKRYNITGKGVPIPPETTVEPPPSETAPAKKPKVTPQAPAIPGMAPLGVEPTKQEMVDQAKADLDAMDAAAPTTEEDIPDIPDFLKRKTGDREVAPVVEEPVPIVTKPVKARRKKRKTPEQMTRLRQLGYSNAAIGRLTEAEATVNIAKGRKYVKEAKKKQPPVAKPEEQAKEAEPSPADLEGIEIEYPVTVEETQETVTVKAKAATALKNVDTRIAALTDLTKCLK